jgi:hypothetical protein
MSARPSITAKAADYRARAEQADELASKVRDPEAKHRYREIAPQWREIVEKTERHSRGEVGRAR